MSRINTDDSKAFGLVMHAGLKASNTNIAISGAFTVSAAMGPIVKIDPTGAQNVTMPTKGSKFILWLIHGSSNNADLTIKDSTTATIGTLSQNEMGMVIDDGITTRFGMMPQT